LASFTQYGPRSLQEEFLTDVCFFACVLVYGLVGSKRIPWVTVATHLIASSAAALSIFVLSKLPTKTRRTCEGLAVAVGACGAATALVDAIFISQLISKYVNEHSGEPGGFVRGVGAPDAIAFALLLSTHALSVGIALYRIARSSGELGARSGFVALGATLAAGFAYEVWLFDVGSRGGAALSAHPYLVLAFTGAAVFDTVSHFAAPEHWGEQTVWTVISVVLAMEYITLIGNVSLFFGTQSLTQGGSRAPGWTHKYPGPFAKGEGVFLVGALVAAQACRCAAAAPPKGRMLTGVWKTPATGGEADTFASATKMGLYVCVMVLAPMCSLTIIMQGQSTAISKFVFLLYTTQLYARYWIQLGAVHWKLVTVVNVGGVLCDAAICVETLYLHVLVQEPSTTEISVVVVTAGGSALACMLGILHHVAQRMHKRRKSKNV